MKQIIITFFLISNICFTQQIGMITPKWNSGAGLWLGAERPIDCKECDLNKLIGGSYLMKNGIELGLEFDKRDNREVLSLGIDYHIKTNSIFNISIGLSYVDRESSYTEYVENV